MNEPHLVDTPTHFPQACELCGAQKGPMVDTGIDRPLGPGNPGSGIHVYACRVCIKKLAALCGFAKGEKLDQLENAAEHLSEAERVVGEQEKNLAKLTAFVAERDGKLRVMDEELDRARRESMSSRFAMEQAVGILNQSVLTSEVG